MSSWYSGCPVCSGSRAALMTGRQFNRVGVPGVFGPTVKAGLPLNETTVADQLKKAGYATVSAPPIVLTVPFFWSGSFLFFKPLFLKLMLAFFVFFFFCAETNQAIMGKWHLGQRPMFLPAARGFDTYMGIPYSDDMGEARRTPCT